MKKPILLLSFMAIIIPVFSQRYSDSYNIGLSGGIENKGYNIRLRGEKFLSEKVSFQTDLSFVFDKRNIDNTNMDAKIQDYMLIPRFNYYFLESNIYFFPYVSIGGFIGKERLTNRSSFPDNIILNHKNKMIYGPYGAVGIEYNFEKLSIYLEGSPNYDLSYKRFFLSANLGLKYYF